MKERRKREQQRGRCGPVILDKVFGILLNGSSALRFLRRDYRGLRGGAPLILIRISVVKPKIGNSLSTSTIGERGRFRTCSKVG